jgi:DNA-binding IclR family transcriptional regulator
VASEHTTSGRERAVTATLRTLDVLEFVGQQGLPTSAAEISAACGIPRSSLYKILRALESRGYLACRSGEAGWTAGQRLVQLRSDSLLFVHGMAVLEALENGGGRLPVAELAERADMPRDMAERVLGALTTHGLVMLGYDGTYGLGLHLVSMASRVGWVERLQLTARPVLVRLRDESKETASLVIKDAGEALYLDQVESSFDLRCRGWVGRRASLTGTSVGEAFADPSRPHIVHDAIEAGVTAISCAIRGLEPSAGVNIIGPTWRLEQNGLARWADLVRRAAHDLEDSLAVSRAT